jgi:hypothetical protein
MNRTFRENAGHRGLWTVRGRRANEEWFYRRGVGLSRWLKVVVAYEGAAGEIRTAFARRAFP